MGGPMCPFLLSVIGGYLCGGVTLHTQKYPFYKTFLFRARIFFKIAEDVAEHIGQISCEANFLIETLLRGVLTPRTSRNSAKRPKTVCRAQTVRFSGGSLKRKSIFRTILLIREEILPQF